MTISDEQENKNAAYIYAKALLFDLAQLTSEHAAKYEVGDLAKIELAFERYKRAYSIQAALHERRKSSG